MVIKPIWFWVTLQKPGSNRRRPILNRATRSGSLHQWAGLSGRASPGTRISLRHTPDRHGAGGFRCVISYVSSGAPSPRASPRTRKPGARLRRKEGGKWAPYANNWATGLRPESTDRHGADGFGYVIRYVWAPGPITMASPRTRKRSARLRRKEGWVVTAVLQQLGNPVARPLVPKAAAQPFGARSREQSHRVHQHREWVGWWLQVAVPKRRAKGLAQRLESS